MMWNFDLSSINSEITNILKIINKIIYKILHWNKKIITIQENANRKLSRTFIFENINQKFYQIKIKYFIKSIKIKLHSIDENFSLKINEIKKGSYC